MKLNRIKWNNDKPATEKQIAFAKSLLRNKKADLPALTTLKKDVDIALWSFWNAAEIPADLTFREASKLIDEIKGLSFWNSIWTVEVLGEIVFKRIEGGPLNTGMHNIMLTSVFAPVAIQFIVDLLKDVEPELYEKAIQIRNERKTKAA